MQNIKKSRKGSLNLKDVPTWGEVRQMISASKAHMKFKYWLYVAMLAYTGARRSEILNLEKKDIVRKDGEPVAVRIRQLKRSEEMYRKVPLVESIRDDVRKHIARLDESDELFDFTTQTAWRKVKKASQLTLDRAIRPHALRHAFAFRMLEETENLEKCRRLLGHTDYDTLKIYLESSQMDLSEDIEKALEV